MGDRRGDLPSGTVTLLFTDIEGSTRLLHEHGDAYAAMLEEHRDALREAFARHGGIEVDTQGDAFFYAFASARAAAEGALEAQAALEAAGPVRVRIGLHTGEPMVTSEGYVGMDVHRAARVMAAGHGGQTLASQATRELLGADQYELVDLGEHRLKDLSAPQRLWQLGSGSFPPLHTLHQSNLPVVLTPLIGRRQELAAAGALLRTHRLVTLVGPGGSGKTRLALQLAADAVDEHPDGVWWVPLAAVTDPQLVLPAIGQALGTPGDLAIALRSKRLLLVLDNLEQVIESAGDIAALLASTTDVRILVTSREPLLIDGEAEYAVDPLVEDDAVALFMERAEGAGSSEVVREICRRLDQLPLAIELAAARTAILDPEDLLRRLATSLPLLTGGRRDVPERQRTLRATIEWSHQLLTDPERILFRRLGVFAGGFTLAAAEAVAGADADTLQSLVTRSLVRRADGGRFAMLETIREFAGEELARDPGASALREAHALFFLELAETASPELRGSDQLRWLDELEREHPNLRVALAWSLESGRPDRALRLCVAMTQFWLYHSHPSEGRRWLSAALAADAAQPADSRQDTRALRADALNGATILATIQADHSAAVVHASEMLELAEGAGDDHMLARAHLGFGRPALALGDANAARGHLELAVERAEALDDGWTSAMATFNLAYTSLATGEFERARAEMEEARRKFAGFNDRYGVARSLTGLGAVAVHAGNSSDAIGPLREALPMLLEVGDREGPAWALELMGVALVHTDPEASARLLGAAEMLREELGTELVESERAPHERAVSGLATSMDTDHLRHAWDAGRALGLADAAALALRNP